MCGRFTLRYSWEEVRALYDLIRDEDRGRNTAPRTNIAPTEDVLWIAIDDGEQRLIEGRWGLVPHWSNDRRKLPLMINARSETLSSKSVFKAALKHRRCLIPADGYYEWTKAEDGGKDPWYLRLKADGPFSFAGLWATNAALGITSCTIVTAPAATQIAAIHDRMPVILPRTAYRDWLSSDVSPEAALQLLQTTLGPELIAFRVGRAVNKAGVEGLELIEPIG